MEPLTETQLAYIAGIMDGEGEFSICKYARRDSKKRKRGYGLKVSVRIAQARRSLLDSIANDVGKHNTNIGRTGKDGAYFFLRFTHACLVELIPMLIPYLRLKAEQATIALEFLNMPKFVGRNGMGDKEWKRRMRLRNRCCKLNTTPQALKKHRENGTKPHYMQNNANTPFISIANNS